MAYSPTIVAASLSDEELKKSVKSLVDYVDTQLNIMVASTNIAVNSMEKKLKSLGSIKIDSGGAADGGASRRTKAQSEETKAINETANARVSAAQKTVQANNEIAASYDRQAQAMQSATQPKSARDSYYTFAKHFSDQAKSLEPLIRNFEQNLSSLIQKRIDEINSRISVSKVKVQELNQELNRNYASGNTAAIQQTQNALEKENRYIKEQENLLKNVGQEFVVQKMYLTGLVAEQQNYRNYMRDNVADKKQEVNATQEQVEKERQVTSEIQKQAQAIRNSKEWKEKGRVIVGDNVYYDPERSVLPKKQVRTLEEQILDIQQRQADAQKKITEETRNTAQAQETVKGKFAFTNNSGESHLAVLKRFEEYKQGAEKTISAQQALQSAIAKTLSIGESEVKNYDIRTASVKQLNAMLKQQKDAYNSLSMLQRNQKVGNDLLANIHRIEAQLHRISAVASHPINLKVVMDLPTKTLDDIAYKIRQLKAYRQGIDISNPNNAKTKKELDDINRALGELKKKETEIIGVNNNLLASNNALGRSWNYMKNRLAFYFTVGASTQFVKNLIDVRSQYEMNERALGILINSAERGTQIFQELSNMALVSPYTLIELSTAAKQLVAYDVAAKDVVDTTRRLADMTAAVGIPIERLTYALGQIKAYGYLNARDARMFSNAGIPLVKQLSEYYSELEGKLVSTADVYDRIKKKAIGYNDVMQVVNKMTDEGGKFFDFQAKMADTLKVRLANLTLAWNNMLNDIGKSEQGVLSSAIGLLKDAFLRWKDLNRIINDLVITFGVLKAAHLVYYGVVLGTNKAIAIQTVLGTKLTNVLKNLGSVMNQVLTSGATWWSLLALAVSGAVISIIRGNEAMKEFNKSLRDDAKTTYDDLTKFSTKYADLRKSLTKNGEPQNIDNKEAAKAWEVVKEQLELSSNASSVFIGNLMKIENVSERLRQGFKLLDDIQAVAAAIKEFDDIKIKKDWSEWWNLWTFPDGTIENLKDAHMWLSKITEEFGSLEGAGAVAAADKTAEGFKNLLKDRAAGYIENYEKELEKFRKDLSITTQSVIDFIELKGWSNDATKIEESFNRIFQKLALTNNLSPKELMTLRLESAQTEYDALAKALQSHINDEKAALTKARDANTKADIESRLKVYNSDLAFLESNTAQSRVYWEDFNKWMGEQHKSEVQAMFRGQSAEQIKMLDFSKGEYNKWVTDLAQKYAKEHGMAYKDVYEQLKNYIFNANQWSIRIPLIITTEDDKSELSILEEADKAVDKATEAIKRLKVRQKELKAKGAEDNDSSMRDEDKELAKVNKEIISQEKDLADAIAKGGHGKKAAKAAAKAQATAEKELTEAFKNELTVIKEMQSNYDKLRKSGVDDITAIEMATDGYDDTLKRVNRTFAKYGVSRFNASDFVGKNINTVLATLEKQRSDSLASGKLKSGTLKDLDVKINELRIDAKTYNMDMITKGLNNELDKLKNEYELSVELDANPELGGAFADMFGIDTSNMVHSIDEYMKLVQEAFDKSVLDMRYGNNINLDVFAATEDSWRIWAMNVGLSEEQLDEFSKKFKTAQDFAKKWADDVIKQTKSLQYSLADTNGKIAIKQKEHDDLQIKFEKETNEKRKELLRLQIQEQENAIAELRAGLLQEIPEYAALFNSIVERSDYMTRRLVANLKKIYDEAKARGADAKGNYTIIGADGQTTQIGKKQFEKEYEKLTREERKSQAPFKKIKEAFSKDSSTGLVDWAKGLELVGGELQKVQGIVGTFGNIAEALGADPATVETINDIATSIGGVATAAQGIAQIASGDYIGGAASLLSGMFTAVSTWFDNSNNRINESIKDSELAVKRLENQYKKLQAAVEDAYGTMAYAAEKAAIANKKLQLEEMRRQLRLEQSRESKNRDDDKIESLKGQIIDLEREIQKATDNWINDMLGISSVGDAAEQLVASMIDAFRQGEDYMGKFYDSFEEMIENMIMKAIASKVIGEYIETMWDNIKSRAEARSQQESQELENAQREYDEYKNRYDAFKENENTLRAVWGDEYYENLIRELEENLKNAEARKNQALKDYEKAIMPTPSDVADMRADAEGMSGVIKEWFDATMEEWGITFGDRSGKNLSNLQQGIAGVSEDTAGALEGYMNGISQQVYLQSEYLRQIVEFINIDADPMDDVKVASLSQILLQLQTNYTLMQTIDTRMENWSTATGNGIRVELLS